jgi:hypothetical protein
MAGQYYIFKERYGKKKKRKERKREKIEKKCEKKG